MNINKLISIVLLLLVLSLGLASCNFSGIVNTPGGGEEGGQTPETPEQPEEPENPDNGEAPSEEKTLTYEEYIHMTADEQKAFVYSFEDSNDFFLWFNEAKAKYDEDHKVPEIDGDINIGDLLGPQD